MEKKIEDYTAKELYDLYLKKYKEENEGSNLYVYRMELDCGRMGELNGTFLAYEEDIFAASGKCVYFGEVLGKHSDVMVDDFDQLDIELVSDDPLVVQTFQEYELSSGYNPFDYIEE